MGTSRGLESLRALLSEWSSGQYGPTRLLGVAVTTPVRRVPRALHRSRLLVCSAAPASWRLPWIAGLELDGLPERYPHAYARLAQDLEKLRVEGQGVRR
ncbi:hypothetical protein [Bifidobacterium aemilianum]|nr:hypothetical protein [Bifidobacterium aemilianum]